MKRIKRKLKQIIYYLCTLAPLKVVRRVTNKKPLVINYHSIQDIDPDPVINKNTYRSAKEFEKDILFLRKHYSFVTLQDLINYKTKGKKLEPNSVFLTFDDGLSVVYNIFRPILVKHNVSASFFLNPDFIDNKDLHFQRKKNLLLKSVSLANIKEKSNQWLQIFSKVKLEEYDFISGIQKVDYSKSFILDELLALFNIDIKHYLQANPIYLSSNQVNEMISEGFTFGGHSMDHPKYDELSIDDQTSQTIESIKWVKEKYNLDYSTFAFPLRDHNMSVELFNRIKTEYEISFGVMGMGDDIVQNHIQRIDAESTNVHISLVLKFEYIKVFLRKVMGKKFYKRPNNHTN